LIIPGATAYLLTDRFQRMLLIAPAVSIGAAVTGLYLSYHLDTASSAMIVVVQGVVFVLAYLFAPKHGVIGRRLAATRNRADYPDGADSPPGIRVPGGCDRPRIPAPGRLRCRTRHWSGSRTGRLPHPRRSTCRGSRPTPRARRCAGCSRSRRR